MKIYLAIAFILLFTSFYSIASATTLKVVTEEWPPFILNTTPVSGITTTQVQKILNKTAIPYEIFIYPWARSYRMAKTEPNTLIYLIYRSKGREPYFHWFCPLSPTPHISVFKLKSNKKDISSLASLKNLHIGIMRGDNSHENLKKLGFIKGIQLDISTDEISNVKKLIGGRVDVIIQAKESIKYRFKQMGYEHLAIESGYQFHTNDSTKYCMALSKGSDPEIIEKISQAFNHRFDK